MLDLLQLKTFRMVVVTESFSRAATELGTSQSNVTVRIKALERELGAKLFERFRFSRKVVVTEVGRQTFEYAGRILALADETKVAVHRDADPDGVLRVSAPESLLTYRLPGLLHRFQTLYPQVRLAVTSSTNSEMLTISVSEGLVDMAFVVDRPVLSDRVTVGSLIREELFVVAAPDYDFVPAGELKPEDLTRIQMLFTDKGCSFRLLLHRILDEAGVKLDNTLEVGSVEAVKQCVMAGVGIAILPRIPVMNEVEQRLLVRLSWTGPELAVYTQMIKNKARWTLPALSALWNLAQQTLGAELAYQLSGPE